MGTYLSRLAVRDVFRRRNTSVLLVLTLALMMSLTTAIFVSTEYLSFQYKQLFEAATSPVDLIVSRPDNGFFNQTTTVSAIQQIEGVDELSPRLQLGMTYKLQNGTASTATVMGVEQDSDVELNSYQAIQALRFQYTAVLSADLALRLYGIGRYNSTNLSLIDASGRDFNVSFGGSVSPTLLQLWMRNTIFLSLNDAQLLENIPGQANVIVVKLHDFTEAGQVASLLARKLGSNFEVRNMKAGISEQVKSDQETLALVARVPLSYAFIFSAAFFVATLSLTLMERGGELRLMKVLGATRGQLLSVFGYEAAIIGLLGLAVGILLERAMPGFVLTALGAQSSFAIQEFLQSVNISTFEIASTLGLISTFVGFLLPVIARTTHISYHKNLPQGRFQLLVTLLVSVVILSFVALHPLGLNTELLVFDSVALVSGTYLLAWTLFHAAERLALKILIPRAGSLSLVPLGLRRYLKSHFGSMILLSLAVSLVVITTGTESSILPVTSHLVERYLGADMVAKPAISAPANLTLRLQLLNGVNAVTPIFVTQTQLLGSPIALVAIDPKSFSSVVSLYFENGSTPNPYLRMITDPSAALVARPLLDLMGNNSGQDLKVGSSIMLPAGKGFANLTVTAVIASGFFHWLALNGIPLSLGVFISYEKLFEILPQPKTTGQVSLFLLKLNSGADFQAVSKQLAVIPSYPLQVFSVHDVEREAADAFNSLFLGLRVLTYLSIVMATFSLMIIAGVNIFERSFELGLFKVLGMTRRQSLTMFGGEFILTVALGSVLGLFSGYAILSEVISLSSKRIPVQEIISTIPLANWLLATLLPPLIGGLLIIGTLLLLPSDSTLRTKPVQLHTDL